MKCFGLIIVFVIVMTMFVSLSKTLILANELDKASKIAVEQTQKKMKEVTVSRLNKKDIEFSDSDYENYFIESFKGLVEDEKEYELKVQADACKGILMVDIDAKNSLVKDVKNINIVDVLEDKQNSAETLYFAKQNLNAKNDNVIFEKYFDDEVKLSDFYIDATSYMVSDESKYFDCTPELLIYGDGDRLLKSFEFIKGTRTYREYEFEEGVMVKHIKVVCTGVDSSHYDRDQRLRVSPDSYITIESEICSYDVYNRYIRDSSSLADNSLWQRDIYSDLLNEYLGKLYA
ncbi:MAG: hypothetical protein ACI4WM_03750 [Erysipelotrichaceae bacterium]